MKIIPMVDLRIASLHLWFHRRRRDHVWQEVIQTSYGWTDYMCFCGARKRKWDA